jgi:hypothetical protein
VERRAKRCIRSPRSARSSPSPAKFDSSAEVRELHRSTPHRNAMPTITFASRFRPGKRRESSRGIHCPQIWSHATECGLGRGAQSNDELVFQCRENVRFPVSQPRAGRILCSFHSDRMNRRSEFRPGRWKRKSRALPF